MRTLKKALSLVLVLAMVLSLGVTAFAVDKASQFSDYGNVTNKEAVDVLTAIGVINGNTDGTFGPEGNFTRAQAATILSYLTLGKTVANALPSSATKFDDVPATHWAAKFVQYCANEGYINGYGDGKFGPDDKLTATQWALMLLGALGYKAANENIGGAGWEIATTKLAMTAGVASADDLSGTFNRDMAAKMALNTLKATTVTYEGGSNVTINGATIVTGATRKDVTVAAGQGSYNGKDDEKVQLCEKVFPGLRLATASKSDNYGNPATNWFYKSDAKLADSVTAAKYAICSAAKSADATYTTAVKSSTIFNDLGLSKQIDDAKVTVTVNGKEDTTNFEYDITKTGTDKNELFGGQGTLTRVYYDASTEEVEITMVETFIAVVTKVTAASDKTDASIQMKNLDNTGKGAGSVIEVADATGFSKGDVVLYTKYWDGTSAYVADLKSLTVAETITGTCSKITNSNTYTIGGTDYKVNAGTSANVAAPTVNATKEYNFYVDTYGNIAGNVDAVAQANKNYILVLGAEEAKQGGNYMSGSTDFTGKVYGILADGTYGEYTVNYGASKPAQALAINKLYPYTVKNNEFKLEAAIEKAADTPLSKNSTSLGSSVLNSETLFVFFAQGTKNSVEVTSLTTKTGNANIGATVSANTSKWVGEFGAKKAGIAEVVFIKTDYAEAGTTVNYAYVTATKTTTTTVDEDGTKTVYEYTAYTASGEELKLTSETEVDVGIYRYNDKNEIGVQYTDTKATIAEVTGSVIKIGTTRYNVDADIYFAEDVENSTLLKDQEIFFTTDTTTGYINNIWVVTGVVEA